LNASSAYKMKKASSLHTLRLHLAL